MDVFRNGLDQPTILTEALLPWIMCALVVAVLGAALLIRWIITARGSADRTREGLVTDRIDAAVEKLGADRVVRRQRHAEHRKPMDAPDRPGADETAGSFVEDITLPHMEVRVGAIHALGRIARKNLDFHIQIMEILCAYVRENSPASSAVPDHPPKFLEIDTEEHLTPEVIRTYLEEVRSGLPPFLESLPKPRSDIQTALEVLGRRTSEQKGREGGWPDPERDAPCLFDHPFPSSPAYPDFPTPEALTAWRRALSAFLTAARHLTGEFRTHHTYRHDLRNTNLQGYDLSHLDLRGARLAGARLLGADFAEAQLQGADLGGAQMQGVDLRWAQLHGADLAGAQLQGAVLYEAQFEGANLNKAQLQGADLHEARMPGVNLGRAQLHGANIAGAQLQGADLCGAQLQEAHLFQAEMQEADLRGAEMQGADLRGARMEGADLFEAVMQRVDLSCAQMQGANLSGAQMQGANLSEVEMSDDTNTKGTTLRGASLVFTDDATTSQLRTQWDDIIAFLETLPEGAPEHWVQVAPADLDFDTFRTRWRTWAAGLDPPVPIAPDEALA